MKPNNTPIKSGTTSQILTIDDRVLTYYLLVHVYKEKFEVTFTPKYLYRFLDAFLRNSSIMGYKILNSDNEEINPNNTNYQKMLEKTSNMIMLKYAKRVDDFNDLYCIRHNIVKSLKPAYDHMSQEMSNCILELEATLTFAAYFYDDRLEAVTNDYCTLSKALETEYDKSNKHGEIIHQA